MRFLKKRLEDGERLIARARVHWTYSLGAFVLLIAFAIVLIGIWLFAVMMFDLATRRTVLTSRRLYRKRGWLFISVEAIPLFEIASVTVRQGPVGALLGYGAVDIETVDGTQIVLAHLAQPEVFADQIRTTKEVG